LIVSNLIKTYNEKKAEYDSAKAISDLEFKKIGYIKAVKEAVESKIKLSTATINSNWSAGGTKLTGGGTGTAYMLKSGGVEGSEITTVPYWVDVTTNLDTAAKQTISNHKTFITELAKK
jgi:hypothetical protein